MTAIAYRDGVLAADSMVSPGGLKYVYTSKVHKTVDGWLVGCAGDAANIRDLFDWADACFDAESQPELTDDFCAIVVSPTGRTFLMDCHLKLIPVRGPYLAVGSGAAISLGAMYMGANAVKAVEAAIHQCSLVAGEIEYVCLSNKSQ